MTRNPLHSLCPYFAMFPEDFVRDHTEEYTRRGDVVLDCFSGRGTTLLEALLMDRRAAAIDVNPVAYCISGAKAEIPDYDQLVLRIDDLEWMYEQTPRSILDAECQSLPPFFGRAFHRETLRQILFLRHALNWRRSRTDRFIAALCLGSLHGEHDKSSSYFSNQMPRTISTKPAYSLNYWRDNNMWASKRDVFSILQSRTELRYEAKHPNDDGRVVLGDARLASQRFRELTGKVRAVITSPPYYDVTNFEEDQWLRLWFLGYASKPTYSSVSRDDRYRSVDTSPYWNFLASVWRGLAPLMRPTSFIVCRIGAKGIAQPLLTKKLRESLAGAFRHLEMVEKPRLTEIRNRQRDRFQPGTRGCVFEIDYVFSVRQ